MQLIINAGGGGSRLWPLSTNFRPKQFVNLFDGENFLQKTYNRLSSEFTADQIWINTNEKFRDLIFKHLPDFKNRPEKILTEPEKRDHFAALIGHSAVVANRTSIQEPQIFLHADHLIENKDWKLYNNSLRIVGEAVASGKFKVVTAGVKPFWPNTQLGYIEINKGQERDCYFKACEVKNFREKPNFETASKFLENGNFLWNLGYYCFSFKSLLEILDNLYPEVAEIAKSFYKSGKIDAKLYKKIPKTSFDYAVSEKIQGLGVVGLDLKWEDIGNWETAYKYLEHLQDGPNRIQLAGSGNKVFLENAEKKVAFVGVSNLILAETEAGILVIDPKYSAEVKKVSDHFQNKL